VVTPVSFLFTLFCSNFNRSNELTLFILALGEDMYNDGYKNITNIDYSKTVIDNMKERCTDKPEMSCKYMEYFVTECMLNVFFFA
jgi:hypothetical protein